MNKTEILNFKDKLLFELDNVIYNFDDMVNTLKYIVDCKYNKDVNNIKTVIQEFKKYFNNYDFNIFIFICIYYHMFEFSIYKTLYDAVELYKHYLCNMPENEYNVIKDIILCSFINYLSGYEYYNYGFNPELKTKLQLFVNYIYSLD